MILSTPQAHIQPLRRRSKTERKLTKSFKNKSNRNINKKKQQFKCIKSFSTRNYPPKPHTQRQIDGNKVNECKKLAFQVQTKNDRSYQEKMAKQAKQVKQMCLLQGFAKKILKVKRSTQSKHQSYKIDRLKQKFRDLFDIFKAEQQKAEKKLRLCEEKAESFRKHKISNDDSRKPTPSLYLQSTNFEDPTIFRSAKDQNEDRNKKMFPSLKMLNKLRGKDYVQIHKRKKIESCKFVIDPFKNVEISSQKKLKKVWGSKVQNIEEILRRMGMNEISQIEQQTRNADCQIESMSISILELINW